MQDRERSNDDSHTSEIHSPNRPTRYREDLAPCTAPGDARVLARSKHRIHSDARQERYAPVMRDVSPQAYPNALSTLPPAVTGFASTSTKAITQGTLPRFTQQCTVPR